VASCWPPSPPPSAGVSARDAFPSLGTRDGSASREPASASRSDDRDAATRRDPSTDGRFDPASDHRTDPDGADPDDAAALLAVGTPDDPVTLGTAADPDAPDAPDAPDPPDDGR
jgi:hypothetical protein